MNSSDPDEKNRKSSKDEAVANVLLWKQVFNGTFKERKYVKSLNEYRDVIVVHKSEDIFLEKVQKVRDIWNQTKSSNQWIGITAKSSSVDSQNGLESSYQLWVPCLDSDLPLGNYQFCVLGTNKLPNECSIVVKCIRKLEPQDYKSSPDFEINFSSDAIIASLKNVMIAALPHLAYSLKELTTFHNWKTCIKFMAALLLAIFVSTGHFLFHFGEFLIKFMRELSHLIEVLQPVLFGCLNVLNNAIYGLYFMIMSLFKNNPPVRQPPPITHQQIKYLRNTRSYQ